MYHNCCLIYCTGVRYLVNCFKVADVNISPPFPFHTSLDQKCHWSLCFRWTLYIRSDCFRTNVWFFFVFSSLKSIDELDLGGKGIRSEFLFVSLSFDRSSWYRLSFINPILTDSAPAYRYFLCPKSLKNNKNALKL